MLTPETIALALSVARGLIRLGGRLDALMAEAAAVGGPLVIPLPQFVPGPTFAAMVRDLKKASNETAGRSPDPLHPFRGDLATLLAEAATATDDRLYARLLGFYRKVAPARADPPAIDPNQVYLTELRRRLGSLNWEDPDLLQAAFVVSAGRDRREIGTAARVGLLIVDVLAEFGAENTGRFVRDPKVAEVVSAVLARLAKPELESFEQWSPFLRHALSSTLNGMLDARGVLQGHNRWLDAVLVALARSREKAAEPDDFLVGLLQGDGYRLLVAEGLRLAAEKLGEADAGRFEGMTSDFLLAAVPLVEADDAGFGEFFRAHWGDLLRAGVGAAVRHGPALLSDASPLVRDTLMALLQALDETPEDLSFFSGETAYRLADAALGTIAAHPDLLRPAVRKPWLAALVASVAGTLSDRTLRETFSREGLETFVRDALVTFAEHPELLLPQDKSVAFDLVKAILGSVAKVESFNVRPLASAAVGAALSGLAKHPELVDSRFGPHLAQVSGALARWVEAKSLSGVEAAELVSVIAEAMLRNPVLFARRQPDVVTRLVEVIVGACAQDKQRLVAGAALVDLTRRVLAAFARNGLGFVESRTLKQVGEDVTAVLDSGLARAASELGRRLDSPEIPVILAELILRLLRGELGELDPESENFKKVFSTLADALPRLA